MKSFKTLTIDAEVSKLQSAADAAVNVFRTTANSLNEINEKLYTKNDECANMLAALTKTQTGILTSIEVNEKIRDKILGIIEA